MLFIRRFPDPEPAWYVEKRARLIALVAADQLLRAIKAGDIRALEAFLRAFWPFVHVFPSIIRRQFLRHAAHGVHAMPSWLAPIGVIQQLFGRMAEEGRHSEHWRQWAEHYGIPLLDGPLMPEVTRLINHYEQTAAAEFVIALCTTEIFASGVGEMTRITYPNEQWPKEHVEHFEPSHEAVDRQEALWLLGLERADVEVSFEKEMVMLADLFSAVTAAAWSPH